MWAFARNKSINAFLCRLGQIRARATGYNPDAPTDGGPAWQDARPRPSRLLQAASKFIALQVINSLASNKISMALKERFEFLQPKGAGELRVISELFVRIQRKVRTVNRDIIIQ